MRHWLLTYDADTRAMLVAPLVIFLIVLGLLTLHIWHAPARTWVWKVAGGLGLLMFVVQAWLALSWVPPEKYMGDVGRIFYMHVPQVMLAMLALTINFVCSFLYLMRKSWVTDSLAEASAEVGVYLGAVGVTLGSIWAKPTWGVWWTWDPRLTTAAILLVIYTGYLAMRRFVDDAEKRATWSAVMGIFAAVDIPVLYFSVRWWKSMHQTQSNPSTVDPLMTSVLRWSLTAFFCVGFAFMYQRFLIAQAARKREVALPDSLPEGA